MEVAEAGHIEAAEDVQSSFFSSDKNLSDKKASPDKKTSSRKKMRKTFLHLILKCHPRA